MADNKSNKSVESSKHSSVHTVTPQGGAANTEEERTQQVPDPQDPDQVQGGPAEGEGVPVGDVPAPGQEAAPVQDQRQPQLPDPDEQQQNRRDDGHPSSGQPPSPGPST